MEKNMTEAEYKRGNRIAATYFLQFGCGLLALFAAYMAYLAIKHHHYGTLKLQAMICGVNIGLIFFQSHIRKNLQRRL